MNTMNNLISGLFGAIIASLLTILYLYFTEKIRRRHEVYLQVVEYLDEIYIRLQAVFAFMDRKYDGKGSPTYDISGLSDDDIYTANRKIVELSLLHGIRSRVVAEYGEGQILNELLELLSLFLQIYDNLRYATKPSWVADQKIIYNLFYNNVDPLRESLEKKLGRKSPLKSKLKEQYNRLRERIFRSKK